MNITMFGTGYVGLVTGACFAEMGNRVVCIDIDAPKVDGLQRAELPIYEPGLENMVRANLDSGRLEFSTDAKYGVDHGELLFIAVGTPSDEDGSADLRHVLAVARTIGDLMEGAKIIVDKSTVPVGTGDRVRATVQERLDARGADIAFDVVSNPEFLKEGAAVNDFMKPDRIIIGCSNPLSVRALERLYAPFNRNHDKVLRMDLRSAELTKYAANVMLATKISLMNEMANLAEQLDADIESVRLGIGSDPRIGYHFIYPGAGYGGSCFPKDVRALVHIAGEVGFEAELIDSVQQVNQKQKMRLFEKISARFPDLDGKTFALWGLAFKPNTDDMREAPSVALIEALTAAGAHVRGYDPAAGHVAEKLFADNDAMLVCRDRDATLAGADALVIVTEWNEFRSPDFAHLRSQLSQPLIFDGRNLFEPEDLRELGFEYLAIGRGST
ncbi:MAG: UDP-glucose/GDP-mannose dehydrogenase family protein [Pseudomonadota bacterium]